MRSFMEISNEFTALGEQHGKNGIDNSKRLLELEKEFAERAETITQEKIKTKYKGKKITFWDNIKTDYATSTHPEEYLGIERKFSDKDGVLVDWYTHKASFYGVNKEAE